MLKTPQSETLNKKFQKVKIYHCFTNIPCITNFTISVLICNKLIIFEIIENINGLMHEKKKGATHLNR